LCSPATHGKTRWKAAESEADPVTTEPDAPDTGTDTDDDDDGDGE
jgi:hypothetical protein